MLYEVIDTGLLALVMPLAASVLLFGIYLVVKTDMNFERDARSPRRFIKTP
ncbi:hypothetical protein [Roseibium alexandrii]|uniref:Uncharacterized protein n=1 Tax=Roseibium alexandrii (strain DSM 17067 / NCIMB 14079 / DFL-11) TaxID=244592 RepID=A0A5E8GTM2_ROSAD|nr:hypothetical protein [Roseibium alexandrii]EEE43094.1 hypothetical protein SADFL11_380 [Roseibium alexandrii DFL-11]